MNQSREKGNKFLDYIQKGGEVDSSQTGDDLTYISETGFYENEKRQFIHEQIEDLRHYRDLRANFSSKVFNFLVGWCVSLLGLLVSQACCPDFHLSDIVLTTLCGGTTISSIGLVGFIVRGLFGSKGREKIKIMKSED